MTHTRRQFRTRLDTFPSLAKMFFVIKVDRESHRGTWKRHHWPRRSFNPRENELTPAINHSTRWKLEIRKKRKVRNAENCRAILAGERKMLEACVAAERKHFYDLRENPIVDSVDSVRSESLIKRKLRDILVKAQRATSERKEMKFLGEMVWLTLGFEEHHWALNSQSGLDWWRWKLKKVSFLIKDNDDDPRRRRENRKILFWLPQHFLLMRHPTRRHPRSPT